MLETAPSFSIYSKNAGEEERENGLGKGDANLGRTVTIGDQIDEAVVGSSDFSFSKPNMDMDLNLIEEGGGDDELEGEREEEQVVREVIGGLEKLGTNEEEVVEQPASPPMYLAAGLGMKKYHGGAEIFGEERENGEEYYRELLEEYPNHPLVLKKYAQFLQSKGDLQGAEYYYLRATVADPGDGEILSQYAKLVWEVHGDREKALTYFERAAQTAPQDSNVLAAYAKFLWEIDDDEENTYVHHHHVQTEETLKFHPERIGAGDPSESGDIEDYYKRMIEDNPSHPGFLRNYAHFLYQSKGDLQGAEEYYSHAILADPQDGKILSEYAKLVWELYHDKDQTLSYFERALQAAPGDSDVLAAYASFLWEIDDDEELDSLSERVLAG